jgi:uncharacterized protein (DUF433 family)
LRNLPERSGSRGKECFALLGIYGKLTITGAVTMNVEALLKRITIDPDICHGKPCIRHMRYPVEVILELLSAGMTTGEILEDYEDLEYEDIMAVLAFATRLSQVKRLQPVAA